MELTGEVLCAATAAQVRERFFDPVLLKACFPHCLEMKEIAPAHFYARLQRWGDDKLETEQEFRLIPGDSDNEFTLISKALDDNATILTSHTCIRLEEREGGALLTYHVSLELGTMTDDPAFDPKRTLTLASKLFEAVGEKVKKETLPMPDPKANVEQETELEQAMQKVEAPAIELEQEAEQAAAKGFLGGAQGWGLIALGILVLALLIFYR
nr:hypothetical protein [uncultured Cohaesibacter sp.]